MLKIKCFDGTLNDQDLCLKYECNDDNILEFSQWYKYNKGSEIGTSPSFFSDSHVFTGDGYVQDFSMTLSADEFVMEIHKLLDTKDILHQLQLEEQRAYGYDVEEPEFDKEQFMKDMNIRNMDRYENYKVNERMVQDLQYMDFSTNVVFITFNCYEPTND